MKTLYGEEAQEGDYCLIENNGSTIRLAVYPAKIVNGFAQSAHKYTRTKKDGTKSTLYLRRTECIVRMDEEKISEKDRNAIEKVIEEKYQRR